MLALGMALQGGGGLTQTAEAQSMEETPVVQLQNVAQSGKAQQTQDPGQVEAQRQVSTLGEWNQKADAALDQFLADFQSDNGSYFQNVDSFAKGLTANGATSDQVNVYLYLNGAANAGKADPAEFKAGASAQISEELQQGGDDALQQTAGKLPDFLGQQKDANPAAYKVIVNNVTNEVAAMKAAGVPADKQAGYIMLDGFQTGGKLAPETAAQAAAVVGGDEAFSNKADAAVNDFTQHMRAANASFYVNTAKFEKNLEAAGIPKATAQSAVFQLGTAFADDSDPGTFKADFSMAAEQLNNDPKALADVVNAVKQNDQQGKYKQFAPFVTDQSAALAGAKVSADEAPGDLALNGFRTGVEIQQKMLEEMLQQLFQGAPEQHQTPVAPGGAVVSTT